MKQLATSSSGQTEQVQPLAPPVEYNLEPSIIQPYSGYSLVAETGGPEFLAIPGTEILTRATATRPAATTPVGGETPSKNPVVIPNRILYRNYPPEIAGPEIELVDKGGEIVLSRVVVSQTVVVHDGVPTDSTAGDYCVPYRDYIKNVASNEVYSIWPRATITANVLAIMFFTLNRTYTEWYRSQGYDFTTMSSTAFDHKWIYGRNIFESISLTADKIFDNYLSHPGVRQLILTRYHDGHRVQYLSWMTQQGSCSLEGQGYSLTEILCYFYRGGVYMNTTEQVFGVPTSRSGNDLTIGSSGDKVRQMQGQLDEMAAVCSTTPRVAPDGIYGTRTAEAARGFQSTFGLPQTGVVGLAI